MNLEEVREIGCIPNNTIVNADCLEAMKYIPDKSIDCIICDLPYGTTACSWDSIIPFDKLWEQYKRIRKDDNVPILLFGREPFTTLMIYSNIKEYKHKWVWNKKQSGSWVNAKLMPLQIEEDIIRFAKGKVNYYPIMRKGKMRKKGGSKKQPENMNDIRHSYYTYSDEYYPTNILEFPNCSNKNNNIHPTQKPVKLLEYLIKTYSNEGDLILDNCSGSGSLAIAAYNTRRNFICIEKNKEYYEKSIKRLWDVQAQGKLF